jgi:hypothetical protein
MCAAYLLTKIEKTGGIARLPRHFLPSSIVIENSAKYKGDAKGILMQGGLTRYRE